MQILSKVKTVRSNTVQGSKEFNSQTQATQAKKEEQLVFMMTAIKKAFELIGDDIIALSTANGTLKNQIGVYDEKWLEEFKAKLLKQIDDEEKANLIMSKMQKQMKKTLNKWLMYLIIKYGKASLITLFLKEINCKIQKLIN